jgi:cell wall-associated NlpC family hydrolase
MTFGLACSSASAAVNGGAGSGTPSAKQADPTPPAPDQPPAPAQQPPMDPAGGAGFGILPPPVPQPTVPGDVGVIRNGIAYAPAAAPIEVQRVIWAANALRHKPYIYGGGHKSFRARGYDCSGSVSYALHGGGLLATPLDSSDFMKWGQRGKGAWITVYTNPGHAWMIVAGLRLDTSGTGESGPRWRAEKRSARGFRVRHPQFF